MAAPQCCADIRIIMADFLNTHCSSAWSDVLYDLLSLEELAVLSGSVMKEEIHKGFVSKLLLHWVFNLPTNDSNLKRTFSIYSTLYCWCCTTNHSAVV